jgi:hypothetical protein
MCHQDAIEFFSDQRVVLGSDGKIDCFKETGWDVAIMMDGHLFNVSELKEECKNQGHPVQSDAVEELIFRLYQIYREEFMSLLNGAFSIVLVDRLCDLALLIRDPMGLKPLFYHVNKESVIFGSNITLPNPPEKTEDIGYTYQFAGWDIDGDQVVDEVPNTVKGEFSAKPIYTSIPKQYTYKFLNSDGSILTTAMIIANYQTFLNAIILPAGTYTISLEVTNILKPELTITDTPLSLVLFNNDTQASEATISSGSPVTIELDKETNFTVSLVNTGMLAANLVIKPQIEMGPEKTNWAPNMDKIGTYVDRRFNSLNAKIKVLTNLVEALSNNNVSN